VPIICPKEVLPVLQYLANPSSRRIGGVKPGNPYLFANTGKQNNELCLNTKDSI
jgi:hypothetical protein